MNDAGSEKESSSTGSLDCPNTSTVQYTTNSREQMKHKMHDDLIDQIGKNVEKEMKPAVNDLLTVRIPLNLRDYESKQLLYEDPSNRTGRDAQRQTSTSNGKLPGKVFRARNSLLTDMMEVRDIKTIYRIFVVMLIILFLNTVVHDFVDTGSINLGLRPIIAGFGKFHIALMLWCCMQISTFLLYPCFRIWAANHKTFTHGSIAQRRWDWAALVLFISYQCGFIVAAIKAHLWFDLPPASGVAYLMEMTRFLMKAHAFIRSNVPKALTSDNNNVDFESIHVDTSCGLPSFSTYAYFLFAPTLVYRDEYPRTRQIRWRIVVHHSLEVVGCVFYISFIMERLLAPLYEYFGIAEISTGSFIKSLFCNFVPGTLFALCFFYCSLHACMNIVAELTRFADRMFYRDWWNQFTFGGYIRSWNIVVSDFLYTYLYNDFVEYVFLSCRLLAMLFVFTVLGVFYEIILAFTFRFFYPVTFVQYGFLSLLLMFAMKLMGKGTANFLLWLAHVLGNGFLVSLYSMEYYARQNCPDIGNSILDYFVPVSWSCNGITFESTQFYENL